MSKHDARTDVGLHKKDSIVDEIERLHGLVERRAYELFAGPDGAHGDALMNWLSAERELIRQPAVELRQEDAHFEVVASVPGLDPKDLDVQVTPEDLLIRAEHHHEREHHRGHVHFSELSSGQVFRSLHFPERIDPDSVRADCRNGELHVTAAIAHHAHTESPRPTP